MASIQLPEDIINMLFELCDSVTFTIEDKSLRVPKDIVLNACPYFKGLLSGSFEEAQHDVIEIKHTSYGAFRCLVQFATDGSLTTTGWSVSQWMSTIALAHKYQYELLLQKLVEALVLEEHNFKDIIDILNLAETLEMADLVNKCYTTIDTMGDHLAGDEFLFSQLPHELVSRILARDTLFVKEEQLLVAVMAWLRLHPEVDSKSLLAHIRWQQIDDKVLGKAQSVKRLFLSSIQTRAVRAPVCQQAHFPNVNIAALFLDKESKLLAKGENEDDHFIPPRVNNSNHGKVDVQFPQPFRMNTVRFKFFGTERYEYQVHLYMKQRRVFYNYSTTIGYSWQQIHFEDVFVDGITIEPGRYARELCLNSLECGAYSNIPALRDNSFIACENMVYVPLCLSQQSVQLFNSNAAKINLRQACFVDKVALYLRCHSPQWPLDISDERNNAIEIVKREQVNVGLMTVIVLYFNLRCLSEVNICGKNIVLNLVQVECPPDLAKLNLEQ